MKQLPSDLDRVIADATRWRMLLLTINEQPTGWLRTRVIVNLDIERPGPKSLPARLTEAIDQAIKDAT